MPTFLAERILILRNFIFLFFGIPHFWIYRSPDLQIPRFPGPQISKFFYRFPESAARSAQPGFLSQDCSARSPQPGILSKESSARFLRLDFSASSSPARNPQPGFLSEESSARSPQQRFLSQDSSARNLYPICLGSYAGVIFLDSNFQMSRFPDFQTGLGL